MSQLNLFQAYEATSNFSKALKGYTNPNKTSEINANNLQAFKHYFAAYESMDSEHYAKIMEAIETSGLIVSGTGQSESNAVGNNVYGVSIKIGELVTITLDFAFAAGTSILVQNEVGIKGSDGKLQEYLFNATAESIMDSIEFGGDFVFYDSPELGEMESLEMVKLSFDQIATALASGSIHGEVPFLILWCHLYCVPSVALVCALNESEAWDKHYKSIQAEFGFKVDEDPEIKKYKVIRLSDLVLGN